MRRSSFIEQPLLIKPHLQQLVHNLKMFVLFIFFVLITRTLKQDDLATAFSTTFELKYNHLSGLVENDLSLFPEF